jgi:hypothetical protein
MNDRRRGAKTLGVTARFSLPHSGKSLTISRAFARDCSSARGHLVQRQKSMALNRKICKNLVDHSYGIGDTIRRRIRHSSFVIRVRLYSTVKSDERPALNDI